MGQTQIEDIVFTKLTNTAKKMCEPKRKECGNKANASLVKFLCLQNPFPNLADTHCIKSYVKQLQLSVALKRICINTIFISFIKCRNRKNNKQACHNTGKKMANEKGIAYLPRTREI